MDIICVCIKECIEISKARALQIKNINKFIDQLIFENIIDKDFISNFDEFPIVEKRNIMCKILNNVNKHYSYIKDENQLSFLEKMNIINCPCCNVFFKFKNDNNFCSFCFMIYDVHFGTFECKKKNQEKNEQENDKQELCPICLNDFDTNGLITECGHKFHKKCLYEHIKYSSDESPCPICRFKLVNISNKTEEVYIKFNNEFNDYKKNNIIC